MPAAAQAAALTASAAAAQAQLDLTDGPIARVVHYAWGGAADRLLIAIHHVAVDGVSWRILLEALQTALAQARAGTALTPAPATTPWRGWAPRLAAWAAAAEAVAPWWIAQAAQAGPPLPGTDGAAGARRGDDRRGRDGDRDAAARR